ncbi:hypothetical protein [Litchfieldia salsa]|uniref:Uncharacterized protein n=1 Tax=Litchfieldia salsa TaxID=930152 RepID=A0A1H0WQN5_9BACI|nr:hypothetical protein [Litchfieldia salsa]SDP92994.1 hypothetical protein SAMN05216565_113104 [Litchfieldia salsa]
MYDQFYTSQSPTVPYYYWHRHSYFPPSNSNRPYPPVDTTMFQKSAQASQKLIEESGLIFKRISSSEEYAKEIMSAAQQSNSNEVKRLIQSVGVTSPLTISFTPDGIKIVLSASTEQIECCKLSLSLKWS